MNENLKQEFKILILNGYYNARNAHSLLFKDNEDSQLNVSNTIGFLAIANSYINAAKAVYICNEDLSRPEFKEFFHKFRAFSDEVMESVRTDHGHQHSNINYLEFEAAYHSVVFSLGIIE